MESNYEQEGVSQEYQRNILLVKQKILNKLMKAQEIFEEEIKSTSENRSEHIKDRSLHVSYPNN